MDAAATVTKGYQGLRESAAWMDLSTRGKIRVLGEDRARLLHAMTTQDVQSLTPGHGVYAFFLNAQGRILGDMYDGSPHQHCQQRLLPDRGAEAT